MAAPAAPAGVGAGVALGELMALCGLILCYGLIVVGQDFLEAVFGVVKKATGWVAWVPFIGRRVDNGVEAMYHSLDRWMGAAASKVEGAISQTWNVLAATIRYTLHATWEMTQWMGRLTWYVYSRYSLPAIAARLTWALGKLAYHGAKDLVTTKVVTTVVREVRHPDTGRIGGAIAKALQPLRAEVRAFERWTRSQIATLDDAITAPWTGSLAGLRARVKEAERVASRLWARVRRMERVTVGLGAAALVMSALARLGGTWIFCRSWRQVGRSVCRLDPLGLEFLLGLFAFAVVALDPEDVLNVAEDAADELGFIIAEMTGAGA